MHGFPFLLFKVAKSIKTLNSVERLLVLRVPAANDVEEAVVKNTYGMVVPRLVEFSNLGPLVLRHIVDLALLGSVIWVFVANSKEEVFSLIFHTLVKMS